MPLRLPFLGLDFDPLTADEAANEMARRARKLGPFAYVATPNVDHMIRLDREPGLKPLYENAWLTVCDSRTLQLFAEASYRDLPAAPTTNIVEILLRQHIRKDETVLIIGGTQAMADKLRAKFGLQDLRWFDVPDASPTSAEARAQCVDFIRTNPAPFVFLAVGSPQQERIAHEARLSGACSGVAICCGDALERLTGQARRAPAWMRKHRVAWLYRLTSEPLRLLKHYLIDGPRIFLIWSDWRYQPKASVSTGNMLLLP